MITSNEKNKNKIKPSGLLNNFAEIGPFEDIQNSK